MSNDAKHEQAGSKRRKVVDGPKQENVEAQLLNHWSQWLKAGGVQRDVSLNGIWHYLKELEHAVGDRCSMFELIQRISDHIPARGSVPKPTSNSATIQVEQTLDKAHVGPPADVAGSHPSKSQESVTKRLIDLEKKVESLDSYTRTWIKRSIEDVSSNVAGFGTVVPEMNRQLKDFDKRLVSLEEKLGTTLDRFEAILTRAEQSFGWDEIQKVMELQRRADSLARTSIKQEFSEALGPALSILAKEVEPLGQSVGGKFAALLELLKEEALRAGIRIQSIS